MPETTKDYSELTRDLVEVLNRHGVDGQTGTPDFVLAGFLVASLDVAHELLSARARWYGRPAPEEELANALGLDEPVSS